MTERLYFDDSHTTQFRARVVERLTHADQPAVVLDRTYFYPTGGGQPHDIGSIGSASVLDVITRKADNAVLHVLDQPITGDEVECAVNWTRRFDHMQQHTGQHILTQAFVQGCGAHTVGFHLSEATVTIDLDRTDLSPADIDAAEALATQIVFENRPVTAAILTMEQLNDAANIRIRKIPDQLSTDGLRIIDIENFDTTACGGTHVAHTGEIGMIKVIRLEKRGDKLRVEFRCGGRALADYREKNHTVNALAALLTCAPADMPAAIDSLRADLRATQKAHRDAVDLLVEREAAALLAESRLVVRDFPARDVGELRALAMRIAAHEDAVALLSASGDKTQFIFARGATAAGDMGAILKTVFAELDGMRGGGSPAIAQGGGTALTHEQALEQLKRAAALLG